MGKEENGLIQSRFSLQQAKGMLGIEKAIDDWQGKIEFAMGTLNDKASRSSKFQEFFSSASCDSLLMNAVEYFNALLQRAIALHEQTMYELCGYLVEKC